MQLSEGANLLLERQVADAHVDLLGHALVVGEHVQHHLLGRLVQNLEGQMKPVMNFLGKLIRIMETSSQVTFIDCDNVTLFHTFLRK